MEPSGTTALDGTQVVLRCNTSWSGSPPRIHWIRNPDVHDPDLIVDGCVVQSVFTSQYSVKNDETGRCDLVIKAATPDLAAQYRCVDTSQTGDSGLTVIGE